MILILRTVRPMVMVDGERQELMRYVLRYLGEFYMKG